MDDTTRTDAPAEATTIDAAADSTVTTSSTATDRGAPQIEDELLIEEISIDGMCGVY
ncbi:MAG: mycofactocin precursor MftA [Actinomycetota bacterium]